MSLKQSKASTSKEIQLDYNALSVGWHLGKIREIDKDILKDPEHWKWFCIWLEKHFKAQPKNDRK